MSASASPPPIRVGIVDDHAITRYALRRFIGSHDDLQVVEEGSSGREAIEIARRQQAQVLLLDLEMPDRTGLDVLPMIRAKAPGMGVVIQSSYPQEHYAVAAIRLGANGYVCKGGDLDELPAALRAAARGRRYLSPVVADLLASWAMDPSHADPRAQPHERLTQREFQLMLHFARGGESTAIADTLALSPKTVSTYHSIILRKLGLRSNSHITHYAMQHGLVD